MVIAHTKRFSLHKRQILSLVGVVDAFLRAEQRQSFTVFAGKAS